MEKIGGYRLVRKLGEGERAAVWLGHAGEGSASMAAVKVYAPRTLVHDIDREIELLTRASSAHLVELTDIATAPDGRPCLVLRRIDGPAVEQVLSRRSSLAPGEVVTALAPIAAALAELHRVGVAHGGTSARSVLLDQRGAPVLAGFGHATAVGPPPEGLTASSLTPAARDDNERLSADVSDLAALTRKLLDRCPDDPAVRQLRDWLAVLDPRSGVLAELTDRLFDLAPASPVRIEEPAAIARSAFPGVIAPLDGALRPTAATEWIENGPVAVAQRLVRKRLGALVGSVRRPVWVVGGVGVAALVVALAVIPSVGAASGAQGTAVRPTSASSPRTQTTGSPTPESEAALTGDDPVAATTALVSARAACIAERSTGCLATVEQAGSAALEADSYFLRQLQAGGTIKDRRLDGSQPTLVQRLGDSAIVGLGPQTAPGTYAESVLVVREDSGWRIRDLTTGAS